MASPHHIHSVMQVHCLLLGHRNMMNLIWCFEHKQMLLLVWPDRDQQYAKEKMFTASLLCFAFLYFDVGCYGNGISIRSALFARFSGAE